MKRTFALDYTLDRFTHILQVEAANEVEAFEVARQKLLDEGLVSASLHQGSVRLVEAVLTPKVDIQALLVAAAKEQKNATPSQLAIVYLEGLVKRAIELKDSKILEALEGLMLIEKAPEAAPEAQYRGDFEPVSK